jgi:hypothetical protein
MSGGLSPMPAAASFWAPKVAPVPHRADPPVSVREITEALLPGTAESGCVGSVDPEIREPADIDVAGMSQEP